MISEEDKKIIRICAKKYNVSKIILFGSALEEDDPNDIDLGVKGVAPGLFFKFYGELYMRMPMPVDLVDLSYKSLFNDIVEETGVVIYG